MLPSLPPLPMPSPAALLAGGAPDALVPACPRADGVADHTVRTHSGAGGNRRCYVCTCGTVWNQTRPASLQPGEDPVVVYTTRNDLNGRAPQPRTADGKGYRCRDCGELKKGHVCTKGGLSLSSPFPAPKRRAAGLDYKPDAARVQEQYADILQMGDDQNDSAVLAFLRKWDLKPSEATALYKNLSAMKQAQDQLTAIGALASTAQAPPAPPVGVPIALDNLDLAQAQNAQAVMDAQKTIEIPSHHIAPIAFDETVSDSVLDTAVGNEKSTDDAAADSLTTELDTSGFARFEDVCSFLESYDGKCGDCGKEPDEDFLMKKCACGAKSACIDCVLPMCDCRL